MNLCVVVPSQDHLKTAGVRIRYARLQGHLAALGHGLTIRTVDSLSTRGKFADDIFLISKVYDVRANLLIRALKEQNRLVGVDIFDNYFSQYSDVRLSRMRAWMASVRGSIDFALCATSNMRELVVRELLKDIPCHIVNDPYDRFDTKALRQTLKGKINNARKSGMLHMCWFGIGDNPYFSVGLADLHAFRDHLAPFRHSGFDIHLTIMSNMHAQRTERVAMLSRLGLPFELREWSEGGERTLIERSLIAFLPVNAQSFSTVKSLNRAVSALCGGAQVLSVGFPLYAPLEPYIYRSASSLLSDFAQNRLAVRPDTIEALGTKLDDLGNPQIEASALVDFLGELKRTHQKGDSVPAMRVNGAVIHGRKTTGNIHKYARRMGHLSVGSPFGPESLHYDVRLRTEATYSGEPELQFSTAAVGRLVPEFAARLLPQTFEAEQALRVLPVAALPEWIGADVLVHVSAEQRYSALAWYDVAMMRMATILRTLFGNLEIFLAESEAPFQLLHGFDERPSTALEMNYG